MLMACRFFHLRFYESDIYASKWLKIYNCMPGADPGIFVRGGGGPTFRKILTNKKTRGPKGHISYNVPPFLQIGNFCLLIGLKNTNLVEDDEILLSIEFRWILFRGFREEVENVTANQRPGLPSCFSDWPEKHKLGRGRWDLASCQVSLNSVQRYQRRSRKWLRQSEARAAILFFRSAQKNTNLVEDVEILLPVKFRWIPFSGFRDEVENVKS